ncbi:MAG: Magnesium transporting ATPase, P-type 1, partial [uncultured bacterium]
MVNETVLTGESIPIKKMAEPLVEATDEIYEATNILFAGTSLVSGEATGVVIATGSTTAMGEVAKLTTETKRVSSFEVEINHFSRFILRLVVVTLICVFIVNLLLKGTTDWVDLVIFAIALAVGVIPEGLPVVTTFSLSRGARRLAKQQVVVKRLTAIEDLGGIEVLCTDKTGTITENTLTVAEVTGTEPDTTVRYAALAADEDVHDPFDIALCQAANTKPGARTEEIPFDPDRRRNSVLVNQELIVRGAPEVICGFCPDMTAAECQQLNDWVAEQGQRGRR